MSYPQQQKPFNYNQNLPFQQTYQPTWDSQQPPLPSPCQNHDFVTKYRKVGGAPYITCKICKFWGDDPYNLKAPTDYKDYLKKKQNYHDPNGPATPPTYPKQQNQPPNAAYMNPPDDPQMNQLLEQMDILVNITRNMNSFFCQELNEIKNVLQQQLQIKQEKDKKSTLFASFKSPNTFGEQQQKTN